MPAYLDSILTRIPQVISQIDREPFSRTFGSGDRVYWCWKFTDYPGARFQEYIYALSWLYCADIPLNQWKGNRNILSMIEAGLEYWKKIQYGDGSFDEAYPFEHSLAATAFTMFYLTEGYNLVQKDMNMTVKAHFLAALDKAAAWMSKNDEEHGVLSNHLAAAASGMYNAGSILSDRRYIERAWYFVERIYAHQSVEGWYKEYEGADIGYQTHASFYLARIWQKTGDEKLLASLKRANRFLTHFIHPDGSIGGEYASRNTMFYYPAAYEMLYDHCSSAAMIADFQRAKIQDCKTVGLEQMDAYNVFPVLNNYIYAFEHCQQRRDNISGSGLPFATTGLWEFPEAGLVVKSTDSYYAVVGCKKGGVARVWNKRTGRLAFQSCGYLLKLKNMWLSSQAQGASSFHVNGDEIEITAPFVAVNQKLFGPWLFMAFRLFTLTVGRFAFAAYAVKKLLVNTLVRRKRRFPASLLRTVRFLADRVVIEDRLPQGAAGAVHLDKFSTFHMGSSRYAHMEEEMIRGEGYDDSVCEFRPADAGVKSPGNGILRAS